MTNDAPGSRPRILVLRRTIWALAFIGSAGALTYGVYTSWRDLRTYEWQLDYVYLFPAWVSYCLALTLAMTVWHSITRSLGSPTSFRTDMKLYCFTSLLKHLPTGLWFVSGRLHLYQEAGIRKALSSVATLAESVVSLTSAILVYGFLRCLSPGSFSGEWHLWVAAALAIVLVAAARPGALLRSVDLILLRLRHEPLRMTLDRYHAPAWLAMWASNWILGGLMLYFVIRTFYPVTPQHISEIAGAWALSGIAGFLNLLLPLVLIRELTLAYLLSSMLPLPVAIVVSLASRIWLALNEIPWLVACVRL